MKKFAGVCLAAILVAQTVFAQPVSVCASPSAPYTISVNEISTFDGGILATGRIPSVSGLSDSSFRLAVNRRIMDIVSSKAITAEKERAQGVSYDFETITSGDIVSIIIYTSFSSSFSARKEADSINFDCITQNFVSVTDIMGENATELINKHIASTIKQNPEMYNPEFKGVSGDLCFFVAQNGAELAILFDQYEIAPGYEEIVTFSFDLNEVYNVFVTKNDYVILDDNYNVKMMPIRQVCEGLGYAVDWDPQTRVAVISRGGFSTRVVAGKNSYQYGSVHRELDSAPAIKYGRVYLPISFFGAILGASYTVDDNENITFSAYKTKS